MTEQYRHGTGKIALEFPAGIIDKGETPEQAALRELQEEVAFHGATDKVSYLGKFPVNPDRHRGVFHVVFIDGVKKTGATHFDSTEEIETFEISDEELQKKIADGSLNHPLQIAGYYKWKLVKNSR
jgi:8-oxo-dGTP pyrophosphatase MutT (NUDIX family)